MKTLSGIAIAIALLLLGFAVGFPVGRSIGFATGSEWALVQADILAREAGVFMPVYLDDGNFRVVMKQPRNIYKRAWELADRHDEQIGNFLKTGKLQGRDDQSDTSAGQRIALIGRGGSGDQATMEAVEDRQADPEKKITSF